MTDTSCHETMLEDAKGVEADDLEAEIKRLRASSAAVREVADAILAPITAEFGRVLYENPGSEVVIQCEGCKVKLTAGHFMALYDATNF